MSMESVLGDLLRHPPGLQLLIARLQRLDPFQITGLLGDWGWELSQLEEGDFCGSATVLRLRSLLVGKIEFNRAVLQRIRCLPHCGTLIVASCSSGAIFVAGQLLRHSDCVVLDAGAETELLCRGAGTVIALSLCAPAAAFFFSSAVWGQPLALPGRACLMRASADTFNSVRDCINYALAQSETSPHPNPLATASFARRLLLCLNAAMLTVVPIDDDAPRTTRRRAAVERARIYIREHLSEPIRLIDLCHHAYIQQRSLEYGFRDIVGLSPMTYLKVLRLGEVHRRLLTEPLAVSSISSVALDSGFHHLGQFAGDYKRLFMESPSATRMRARLQHGNDEAANGQAHTNAPATRSRPAPALDVVGKRSRDPVAPGGTTHRDSCAPPERN
jgi:AraC family ethanolamine operon transcriptional activator